MVTLTIQLEPSTGKMKVDGPIDNKMLSYAMLELARDVIREYKPSAIVPPNGQDALVFGRPK